jgi:RND superfamily putative drug exporter
MLARLARFGVRRKWLMIFGIWLPLLIVVNGISGAVGTNYHTDFKLPASESKDAFDILESAGQGGRGAGSAQIVFSVPTGVKDSAVEQTMTAFFDKIKTIPGLQVDSPYDPGQQAAISRDGTTAFAQLGYDVKSQKAALDLAKEIKDAGKGVKEQLPAGSQLEYGGQLFGTFEFPPSEALGILAAVLILLIAFGSVLAMGLPIGTALFGLGVGIGVVGLVSNAAQMPEFAPQMAAMIGLGVGIDYALFIVTRFRDNLHRGMSVEDSIVESVDTSGRAVLFAGMTVMISLLGLFIVGLAFIRGLAISGSISVLVMVIAALTLLPALLALVGKRIDTTSRAAAVAVGLFVVLALVSVIIRNVVPVALGVVIAAGLMGASFTPFGRRLRQPLPHRHEKPAQERFWYRWSRFIQRRPWPPFITGVLVLLLLAIPLFSIRLGFGDTGNLPSDTTARKAYDLIADGFGPGFNGPLLLVSNDPKIDQAAAGQVTTALQTDGVAFVSPPAQLGDGIWTWQLFPTTGPQDAATTDLVQHLRDDVVPSTGFDIKVGGSNAASIDFADYLGGRLPWIIGGVLVLSFLLLLGVFRSVLVPLKAVIMNLLSVGAAYGIIVAIFQWGWGMQLIGVDRAGPIEAWAPMMLFAITFGLSMDYEVFLLSRIKEEYDRTGDNGTAVADGVAKTARVITAAALIMFCVFFAFVLGYDRSLKLFGLGLAIAVLVDATIVRLVLVPATMELLGNRNWWIPKWLDRMIPNISIEGRHDLYPLEELETGDEDPRDERESVPTP